MRLSVLDLIPVRDEQTTGQALAATLALAARADGLGFHRYWVAEHHNMHNVASTSPAVTIPLLAGVTGRIRLGAGGVMLLNHQPLQIAEQFALLSEALPGRVDLGIGRAPGSDPVTSSVLHASGEHWRRAAEDYPQRVVELLEMLGGEYSFELPDGSVFPVSVTPRPGQVPPHVWMLGSSRFSARLAARLGLDYVYANHFAGNGADDALRAYRAEQDGHSGRAITTATVVIGETAEQAARLARPALLTMAELHSSGKSQPLPTVEGAAAVTLSASQTRAVERLQAEWFIGTAQEVARDLKHLAHSQGVDEVIVQPVAGAYADEPNDRTLAREQTLDRLASACGLVS